MSKKDSELREARESELKAIIENTQQSFKATLGQIQHEAQPSTQAKYLKENLVHKAQEAQVSALNTVDEARDGNREAIKKVLIAVGVVAGTIALCIIRKARKRRRR